MRGGASAASRTALRGCVSSSRRAHRTDRIVRDDSQRHPRRARLRAESPTDAEAPLPKRHTVPTRSGYARASRSAEATQPARTGRLPARADTPKSPAGAATAQPRHAGFSPRRCNQATHTNQYRNGPSEDRNDNPNRCASVDSDSAACEHPEARRTPTKRPTRGNTRHGVRGRCTDRVRLPHLRTARRMVAVSARPAAANQARTVTRRNTPTLASNTRTQFVDTRPRVEARRSNRADDTLNDASRHGDHEAPAQPRQSRSARRTAVPAGDNTR